MKIMKHHSIHWDLQPLLLHTAAFFCPHCDALIRDFRWAPKAFRRPSCLTKDGAGDRGDRSCTRSSTRFSSRKVY